MNLQRHGAWSAFYNDIQLLEFCETVIPKIEFKSEVHEDVIKAFNIIKKILVHSYYEFIDVAVTKALHAFEMALILRYRQITNSEWNTKRPLKQLIDWFEKGNYFEVYNPAFMDHIRNVRNYFSHPTQYRFGGSATLHWISTIVDLINDLYEDPVLELNEKNRCKYFQIK